MEEFLILYTATLITAHSVIPANAGIQEETGFRVKPGMTNRKGLMSLCIAKPLIPALEGIFIMLGDRFLLFS